MMLHNNSLYHCLYVHNVTVHFVKKKQPGSVFFKTVNTVYREETKVKAAEMSKQKTGPDSLKHMSR